MRQLVHRLSFLESKKQTPVSIKDVIFNNNLHVEPKTVVLDKGRKASKLLIN